MRKWTERWKSNKRNKKRNEGRNALREFDQAVTGDGEGTQQSTGELAKTTVLVHFTPKNVGFV